MHLMEVEQSVATLAVAHREATKISSDEMTDLAFRKIA
jgi:hypothetical protein